MVWKGVQSSGDLSDNCSWAGRYTKRYRIAFYDKDFGEDNCNVVRETMARTPKILWIKPVTWLVISVIAFFSSFFFYEWVIPVFENMRMSDEAFAFIDELVFYFPCIIAGLCAVTCLVFVVIKDNLLYKCAIRCIENNLAAIERKKAEDAIKGIENSKWYYNNCPNCGASAASPVLKSCSFCGTSLEVTDFTNGVPSAVHKIAFVPKKPDIPGSKGDSK